MNFENKIRDKFRDQEWEPQSDRWEQVRAAIQPEKKKRRFLFWWLGAAILLLGMGSTWAWMQMQQHPASSMVQEIAPASGTAIPRTQEPSAAANSGQVPELKSAGRVSDPGATASGTGIQQPGKAYHRTKPAVNKRSAASGITENNFRDCIVELIIPEGPTEPGHGVQENSATTNTTGSGQAETPVFTTEDKAKAPEATAAPADTVQAPKTIAQAQSDDPLKDLQDPEAKEKSRKKKMDRRFSLGASVGGGVWQSQLSSNGSSALQASSIQLNKDIRQTGLERTQRVFFTVNINSYWRAGVSIGLMQAFQDLEYDFQPTTLDPTVGVANKMYNEQYNGDPASVMNAYRNGNDSIMKGSRFVTHNKYYWREIPVYLDYVRPFRSRWNWYAGLGLTYQFAYYINIQAPDIDNVGMVVAGNKDDFPRFRSTLTGNLRFGLEYELYDGIFVSGTAQGKYALRSVIGNANWVQEKPYGAGFSLGLCKKF